jgi:hypothetical protein
MDSSELVGCPLDVPLGVRRSAVIYLDVGERSDRGEELLPEVAPGRQACGIASARRHDSTSAPSSS